MAPRPSRLDVFFAAGSAVITVAVLFGEGLAETSDTHIPGSRWWVLPLLLVPSAALLWRRSNPLITVIGVWVPIGLHALFSGEGGQGLYVVWPAWVSLYALAAYGSRRQLVAGLGVAVVCLVVHDVNDPHAWGADSEAWSTAWWDLFLFVAPLIGGVVAGSRRTRTLATEKALVEAEARVAVAEERARIARELHDVVTHHVNLVVLQAMAASGMLDRDPEQVREPLRVIEASGREALTEMRRLLGVLREEDAERQLAPQPGVDDVEELVGTARTAGLDVGLAVSGTPRRLPAGLALTVYRIVQEALTNAARHAAGSRVGVSLRYEPDAVDVAVVDDGGEPRDDVPHGGRGLLGMRERVAVFAGTLETGPSADGGFAVHARLPVPPEEP
ncbi:sensor histidine kinase [Blastococcus sp. CT_GayMR20]|uniref:sensor histidine kinase n=1 Tax=Blastococcus sp. CT_GayMR20 TaxID=2559609 RepID=UPI0010737238|nr:histidine kinase [Blastococcus sp. CT_GayMR20]TFV80192.1 sensor histidine kinase [Blastococcus sp. CT_GayMR20]